MGYYFFYFELRLFLGMKMNFKEDFENLKCFILMYLNSVVGYVVAWKAPNQPPLRSQ